MRTDDLDFHLPPELIAQEPPPVRSASRLLVYQRGDRSIAHHAFADLPRFLSAGDLLVFNDARVLPARFALRKQTGGLVEGLFLSEVRIGRWRVLLRNAGRNPAPMRFERAADLSAVVVRSGEAGEHEIDLVAEGRNPIEASADAVLARVGRMPLPPYIRRGKSSDPRDAADRERYQTVYSRAAGDSVAAPTAGLHFDAPLLASLDAMNVRRAAVTLAVGMGTFKPVTADRLEDHAMHVERYALPAEAAAAVNAARSERRRVIAVGTTSARVLESQPPGPLAAASGETGIFIRPPYAWRHVGALLTNFHLPRSTLLALVAAMVGLDELRRIYADAVAERYRFFSYGDAMLII